MRKILTACVVSAWIALSGAVPAFGDHDDLWYPTAPWQVRQIETTEWEPATLSTVVDANTVNLTKPAGNVGTSAETADLGLEGDTVTVDVVLDPEASADAGAIRLFAYDHPNGDTLGEAPTVVAVATGSETLSLDVSGFSGKIGTLGLVYDASNASDGTVTFKNLAVDGKSVSFVAHPEPEPPATSDKICEDFKSRAELDAHLEEFPGDWKRLDKDGDGTACEDLDIPPTTEIPTPTKTPVAVPTAVPAGLAAMAGLPGNGLLSGLIAAGLVAVGIALCTVGAWLIRHYARRNNA